MHIASVLSETEQGKNSFFTLRLREIPHLNLTVASEFTCLHYQYAVAFVLKTSDSFRLQYVDVLRLCVIQTNVYVIVRVLKYSFLMRYEYSTTKLLKTPNLVSLQNDFKS